MAGFGTVIVKDYGYSPFLPAIGVAVAVVVSGLMSWTCARRYSDRLYLPLAERLEDLAAGDATSPVPMVPAIAQPRQMAAAMA